MADPVRKMSSKGRANPKVAVACQGGGMHAAFEIGVLTEILEDINERKRFELVGLSGTSAGALCALMVWYGLVPKVSGSRGSVPEAIDTLNRFWDDYVAKTGTETLLNLFTYGALRAEETEIPVLGINAPILFGLNPYGMISKAVAACLPRLGARKQYFDLEYMLAEACPDFGKIDWQAVKTRLLIGASEVISGAETVFDSDCNMAAYGKKYTEAKVTHRWHKRLPLTLSGVAASGTLPAFREAERIDGGYYWDGLYSQNPPVREFLAGTLEVPDELWIIRINPQEWPELPKTNAEIQDRQNELMGNLSLNAELDFILTVNAWTKVYEGENFANDHKHVTVRTIKMKEKTADDLRYSSKFDRSRDFMDQLRIEGRTVARDWLDRWPEKVGCYPDDAGYHEYR
ncbi:MAG TPA: patatin-like phospholipase family protein [Pseudolabrys sp.]|jgi:NTE family protein|nr:patatin-like phospholipase family protein [Pseudolabrys sp.]